MDKCREEFECWYKNFSGCDVINFDEFGFPFAGQYKCASNWLQNTTLLASWQAWKASRESMKAIKLPEATFETPGGDNALREDAVIEAITSAGYEVEQ